MPVFPSFERSLKTLHSWLGVLILPWIVAIGLTGFCLNHWQLVDDLLTSSAYDEEKFDLWPQPRERNLLDAIDLAGKLWPDEAVGDGEEIFYHGRPAWSLSTEAHELILDAATGHYWTKTRYTRKTYDPDGALLHSKVYWGSLFKTVHELGWVDGRFGSWLADVTAIGMVIFGSSGLFLFLAPRFRRRKNRRARRQSKAISANPDHI